MTEIRKLIKFDDYTLEIEDHGILTLGGSISFEDGGGSNPFGFFVDAAFLYRFLGAIGVDSAQESPW